MSNDEVHSNQPAFPLPDSRADGLTKREYFAALALAGWYASGRVNINNSRIDDIVDNAVAAADALIKALNDNP